MTGILMREEYVADRFSKSSVVVSSLSMIMIDWPMTLTCTMSESEDIRVVSISQTSIRSKTH